MEYYQLLLPIGLLLALSKVFMKLCEKFKIPSVVGMLIAGVVVGLINYVPNQQILNQHTVEGLGYFGEVGVILMLFTAGLETDLNRIKSVGGPVIIITLAGVIVPMALGFVVAMSYDGGFSSMSRDLVLKSLFYGSILTATSVSISVVVLRELGKLNSKVGTTIVAAAILDDIVGILVLSFVLSLKGSEGGETVNPGIVVIKTIVYFAVVAVLAFVAGKGFHALDNKFPHHRLIPIFSLAFCFIVSYASDRWFGIADITGAYIVGLILSTNNSSGYIGRKADILGYMIFVPIFFGNIGITTNFSGMNPSLFFFGAMFIIVGLLGKIIGCGAAGFLCRYSFKDSMKVGVGMMARAEVALVTAQKGVEFGIIDTTIMPFIVLLIIVSSFATPIMLQWLYHSDPDFTPVKKAA